MKKIFTISMMIVMFTVCANAQNVFDKGISQIKVGVGFGYFDNFPPLHLSYEAKVHQFSNHFTIGAGGYYGVTGYTSSLGWKVGAEALAHFSYNSSLDFYTGPDLSYGASYYKIGSLFDKRIKLGWIVGLQYYFNDKIGAFLQEGGYSIASLGVSYRF